MYCVERGGWLVMRLNRKCEGVAPTIPYHLEIVLGYRPNLLQESQTLKTYISIPAYT